MVNAVFSVLITLCGIEMSIQIHRTCAYLVAVSEFSVEIQESSEICRDDTIVELLIVKCNIIINCT